MRRLARVALLLALVTAVWMTLTAGMRLSPDPANLVWRQARPEEIRATVQPLLASTTPPQAQGGATEPAPQFDPAAAVAALRAAQTAASVPSQDPVVLGLHLAGLGAGSPVFFSPATSRDPLAGVALALQARAAGTLSEPAAAQVLTALQAGVDVDRFAAAQSAEDFVQAIRLPGFQPAFDLCAELGFLQRVAGPGTTLALLPQIGTAQDAHRFALVAQALGADQLLALLDVAGPGPVLASTQRLSDPALRFIIGTLLMAVLLAMMVTRLLTAALRRLTDRD